MNIPNFASSRNRALALANFAGVSRPWFGFFDYRGRPRCRLHSPRAERMREKVEVTPSAISVHNFFRDPLWLEVKEQNAIADASGVVGLGNLECHEAAIRGDGRI